MAKSSILIADDPSYLELYKANLSRKRHEIRTARDGEEVLRLIAACVPDLCILDLNLPVLDGFEVLAQLPPERRQFPVLVLTNAADRESRYRAMALGADEYLLKAGMTIVTFIQTVERHLRQGRRHD